MILNQFGRDTIKIKKDFDGYEYEGYEDKQLEVLRKWGHRFYSFRDHSIVK